MQTSTSKSDLRYDVGKMLTSFCSLRSIIRGVLGSGIPGVANAFTSAARDRLRQTNAKSLPTHQPLFAKQSGVAHPTPHLQVMLARARSIYGAGMGFDSLAVLSEIVRATHGLRWHSAGLTANVLADIDSDISQAIQVGCENAFFDENISNTYFHAEFQGRNRGWAGGRLFCSSRRR